MNVEKIHKSKEPWKKKEPGARLSNKAVKDQKAIERQSSQMERRATQRVRIYCNKNIFNMPGLFTSFTVKVKIPLREPEIMERMKAAFPELKWEEP